ncbi:uncharacterized protein LOC141687378 isoform X1 [Apium graveolens]|uniref:uncharacterized protein LOC141687378 isoform X1 n=1 Tax=Apium graveolens TaxID=4045 RepID=UPI003D7A45EB
MLVDSMNQGQSEKNHQTRKKLANLSKFKTCGGTCFTGYSGGQASVVGSDVVSNLTTGKRMRGWDRCEVYFHEIPGEVIDSLVEEEIMLKVAGGLTIEHPLTLPLIDTVVGSFDSVMGLSKSLAEKLIQEAL